MKIIDWDLVATFSDADMRGVGSSGNITTRGNNDTSPITHATDKKVLFSQESRLKFSPKNKKVKR